MIELNAGLTQKAIELSQRVEQSPNDVAAWLALIEHQDTLLRGDRRRITNAELRSITDSTYSLLLITTLASLQDVVQGPDLLKYILPCCPNGHDPEFDHSIHIRGFYLSDRGL